MSEYQIIYRKKDDEFAEWFYYFVWACKVDDAIGIFRDNFSKDEWSIMEVARIHHKDFSKM